MYRRRPANHALWRSDCQKEKRRDIHSHLKVHSCFSTYNSALLHNWTSIYIIPNLPNHTYTHTANTESVMSTTGQAQDHGQLSGNNLPPVTTFLTGHDDSTGKAIVAADRPASWTAFDDNKMAFDVVYTTYKFPPSMNDDVDIKAHDALLSSKKLGLVNPGGTVCRRVDFAPGSPGLMHRTQSLDYGIVVEGSIEMVLDSGETRLMSRGDVAVQRATMHSWRNTSNTEWARMIFVLQESEKVMIKGEAYGEDLGDDDHGIVPSQHD